jgi:hypothetical protein
MDVHCGLMERLPGHLRSFLLCDTVRAAGTCRGSEPADALLSLSSLNATFSAMHMQPTDKYWESVRAFCDQLVVVAALMLPVVLEFRPASYPLVTGPAGYDNINPAADR